MSADVVLYAPRASSLALPSSIREIMEYADLFAKSRLFEDSTDVAKAAVKVLAGAEKGIPPFQAMMGIDIIKGKVSMNANLMATLVDESPRYAYKILDMTNTECKIEFFERVGDKRVSIGISEFTMKDAQAAELAVSPMYKKYPRNMLFSRAMSNGVGWYCPSVTGGKVYTPEEMGEVVDESGNVVDVQPAKPPRVVQSEVVETKVAPVATEKAPAAAKVVEVKAENTQAAATTQADLDAATAKFAARCEKLEYAGKKAQLARQLLSLSEDVQVVKSHYLAANALKLPEWQAAIAVVTAPALVDETAPVAEVADEEDDEAEPDPFAPENAVEVAPDKEPIPAPGPRVAIAPAPTDIAAASVAPEENPADPAAVHKRAVATSWLLMGLPMDGNKPHPATVGKVAKAMYTDWKAGGSTQDWANLSQMLALVVSQVNAIGLRFDDGSLAPALAQCGLSEGQGLVDLDNSGWITLLTHLKQAVALAEN